MMNSSNKTAHSTGLFYLLLTIFGVISIMMVPSQIIDWDSAAATWTKISSPEKNYFFDLLNAKELLFIGVVSGILCYTAYIFLAIWFYKLFHTISKFAATSLAIFVFASIPFAFSALSHLAELIPLVNGGEHLASFTNKELATKAFLALKVYGSALTLAEIFWGLWLFPLGYLVYKSDFMPKVLGIALIVGCFYYLMEVVRYFLIPTLSNTFMYDVLSISAMIGEMGTMLWLLLIGTRWKNWKYRFSILKNI